MPPYRLADLSPQQMAALEHLENEIHVTLVAYEPLCDAVRDSATEQSVDGENDLVLDALVDTYRTHDSIH